MPAALPAIRMMGGRLSRLSRAVHPAPLVVPDHNRQIAQATMETQQADQPMKATKHKPPRPSPEPTPVRLQPPAAFTHRDITAAIGLALLVAVSYFPALTAGFIWDDIIFTEEPVIHSWSGLWNIWFSPSDIRKEGHYWPIVYTTFWLEHKLWGHAPLGYHLVNILLHIINTLLIWRLMKRFNVPAALAIAALFAVHPLHVESVVWIIERKDLLSALFYLTAAHTWLRYNEAPHPLRYGAALLLFIAGLLSKSIVITLPVALLIWHWWAQGRIHRIDLLRLAPFFIIGLAITAADLSYYNQREPLDLDYSIIERILIAARVLWFYAGKLLWPDDLIIIYPLWEIQAADLTGWLYVAAAAMLLAVLLYRPWGRAPLAGILFYIITLSPVLGFIDYGFMQFSLVADRFQYLAGIGLIAILTGTAARGISRLNKTAQRTATGAFMVILAILGTLTWQQSKLYRDDLTFFSYILTHNPQARDASLNLGAALLRAGRLQEGLAASQTALQQRPDSATANAHLGYALLLMQRLDEAAVRLTRALELDPLNEQALDYLANIRFNQQRYEEAHTLYRTLLQVRPASAQTHLNLGAALYYLGRREQALASFEQALSLDPHLPAAQESTARLRRSLNKKVADPVKK